MMSFGNYVVADQSRPRGIRRCTARHDGSTGISTVHGRALRGPRRRRRGRSRAFHLCVGPSHVSEIVKYGVPYNGPKLDPQLYTKAYDVPNATPHITLKVGLGFRAIDVGHMMARAKASVWVSAEWLGREGVRMSEDNTLIQIRHSSRLTGEPQVVEVIE